MKRIFFLLLALSTTVAFANEELIGDYLIYKTGMDAFNARDYKTATDSLNKIINSHSIGRNQRIYALIALSKIVEKNDPNASLKYLESAQKVGPETPETKRDLGLSLSRAYRFREIYQIRKSYKIASALLWEFKDDTSVQFNYSVACLYMAGKLSGEKASESEIRKYFVLCNYYANKILKSGKNKEFAGEASNLIGLVADRQGQYDTATTAFKNAIQYFDKAVFHRNLGWAIFANAYKQKTNADKLRLLIEAKKEFEKAEEMGDEDPITKKQIPNMEREIGDLSR